MKTGLVLLIANFLSFYASSALAQAVVPEDDARAPDRVLALEGEFVHDVGAVHLNVTNFGLIGAQPGRNTTYSQAPSLEYPAGSGIDLLWAAGLWVGAEVDGVPYVSTGQFSTEFASDPGDPLDTIFRSEEGAIGSFRYPSPLADDDGDGLEDEDPLDGIDNDLDGSIDEDYAAISQQYFRTVMHDFGAFLEQTAPDHTPLGLEITQESFQWAASDLDDFVGIRYVIRNVGSAMLEDVFLGMFADFDLASAEDDLAGYFEGDHAAFDGSSVPLSLAYAYDLSTAGVAGVMIVDHTTDASGISAPAEVSVRSFQSLVGSATFAGGGDPQTDAERYDLLARDEIDAVPAAGDERFASDYRALLGTGPFATLAPGASLTIDVVFVVGADLASLLQNAANAKRLALGQRYDRDGDPSTGPGGLEYVVPWSGHFVTTDSPAPRDVAAMHLVPNPFNPRVAIEYELPARGAVTLDVYDVRGRHVVRVFEGEVDAGRGSQIWTGEDRRGRPAPSGVYFIRLRQGDQMLTQRGVLVR